MSLHVSSDGDLLSLSLSRFSLSLDVCFPGPRETPKSRDGDLSHFLLLQPIPSRTRKRYIKLYPGEEEGIIQEMRFVAMKLHKAPPKEQEQSQPFDGQTLEPSIDGFLNFLVDSKLLFETLERIFDESNDVAYDYFIKTGLKRSKALSKDLEWFRQQGFPIMEPGSPGINYSNYLEETAEQCFSPLLLFVYI